MVDKELIYRDDVLQILSRKNAAWMGYQWVSELPAVDAVPVVRCRECVHRDPEDKKCDSGELERAGCIFPVDDDYFCKWGKRREEEHNAAD